MLTTILEIIGVACIASFGWFIWPPLALLVVGVSLLAGCWAANR